MRQLGGERARCRHGEREEKDMDDGRCSGSWRCSPDLCRGWWERAMRRLRRRKTLQGRRHWSLRFKKSFQPLEGILHLPMMLDARIAPCIADSSFTCSAFSILLFSLLYVPIPLLSALHPVKSTYTPLSHQFLFLPFSFPSPGFRYVPFHLHPYFRIAAPLPMHVYMPGEGVGGRSSREGSGFPLPHRRILVRGGARLQ